MTLEELYTEINELKLSVIWDIDTTRFSIGNPSFANPILWVDAYMDHRYYEGTVSVKAINVPLFSTEQIQGALILADKFLSTPLKEREL